MKKRSKEYFKRKKAHHWFREGCYKPKLISGKVYFKFKTLNVDNPFKSPAVISICPGILGIERGLKRAGVEARVMAYVEIECFIIENLLASMEAGVLDPAPIWTDAKTFDASPFRGRVHGIVGGYPCPGESVAGLREKHLYKGFIWPAIRRAIAATRPLWCYFENVDDHLTGTFSIVLRSLRLMGYSVEVGIYSAEEIGAPHERQRLFILAKLGNAASREQWGQWIGEALGGFQLPARGSGYEKLANSNILLPSRQPGGFSEEGRESEVEKNQRERSRRESGDSSNQVADTGSERLQGVQPGLVPRGRKGISGSITKCRPEDFPLGQGIDQWQWEEERTVESGLVYTINGYNFSSDLHRAIGNSVVEQTAEIAFINLLKKHQENL